MVFHYDWSILKNKIMREYTSKCFAHLSEHSLLIHSTVDRVKIRLLDKHMQ